MWPLAFGHKARSRAAIERARAWPIDPPKSRHDVGIIASTFAIENPLAEIFPQVPSNGLIYNERLKYQVKTLPVHEGLHIGSSSSLFADGPRAFFDAPVQIPILMHYRTRGFTEWEIWMSLTPMEVWTQASGIRAATGRVVLGGLGMGWLLRQIAKKPTVKEIVVVENDKDLLDWFGQTLCAATPKVSEVICGDFWEHAHKMDLKRDRFVADIWPGLGEADNSIDLARLRATGAKVWAWGSARPSNYQQSLIKQYRAKVTGA